MAKKKAKAAKAAKAPKAAKKSKPASPEAAKAPPVKEFEPPNPPAGEIMDINTHLAIDVRVLEGKGLKNAGDGDVVFVEHFPSNHLMTQVKAAGKFAYRKSDGVAFYSERGDFNPAEYQLFDVVAYVKKFNA